MSGGSFNYAYNRVVEFADDLAHKLDNHDAIDRYGETPYNFNQVVLDKLREIEYIARYAAILMREAEWLYSGDTSETSFLKNVTEIERINGEQRE
jgi:hypothetical protein